MVCSIRVANVIIVCYGLFYYIGSSISVIAGCLCCLEAFALIFCALVTLSFRIKTSQLQAAHCTSPARVFCCQELTVQLLIRFYSVTISQYF